MHTRTHRNIPDTREKKFLDSVAATSEQNYLTHPISGSFHTSHFINLQGGRFPGCGGYSFVLSLPFIFFFHSSDCRAVGRPGGHIYMLTAVRGNGGGRPRLRRAGVNGAGVAHSASRL